MTLFEPDGTFPRRRRERQRRRSRIWAVSAVVVAVGALLVFAPWDPQRGQAITDQFTIWMNPAPAEIEALAVSTGMSETGRRIFFASTPELDEAGTFNERCPVDEQIVLGCYASGEIYLYRINDERLAGTNEVTAAHEMLHAAYERLPAPDKARIDVLIESYVATLARGPSPVLGHGGLPGGGARRRTALPAWNRARRTPAPARELLRPLLRRPIAGAGTSSPRRPPPSTARTRGSPSSARNWTPWGRTSRRGVPSGMRTRPSSTPTSSATTPAAGRPPRIGSTTSCRTAGRPAKTPASCSWPTSSGTTRMAEELNQLSATSNELYQQLDSMAGAREPAP